MVKFIYNNTYFGYMDDIYKLDFGNKVALDSKDKKIIKQLQLNARLSISEIARKTGIPRDVVKYRIKRLEQEKVIRFYHAFLNPSKLGVPMYTYVLFSLTNFDPETEKKFISFLTSHKKIIYVAKLSGNWDMGIGVCSKDFKDFDNVLFEIRTKFSSIIKEFHVGSVIDEYKYDYMVDLID